MEEGLDRPKRGGSEAKATKGKRRCIKEMAYLMACSCATSLSCSPQHTDNGRARQRWWSRAAGLPVALLLLDRVGASKSIVILLTQPIHPLTTTRVLSLHDTGSRMVAAAALGRRRRRADWARWRTGKLLAPATVIAAVEVESGDEVPTQCL